jgi:hypothetical protein
MFARLLIIVFRRGWSRRPQIEDSDAKKTPIRNGGQQCEAV